MAPVASTEGRSSGTFAWMMRPKLHEGWLLVFISCCLLHSTTWGNILRNHLSQGRPEHHRKSSPPGPLRPGLAHPRMPALLSVTSLDAPLPGHLPGEILPLLGSPLLDLGSSEVNARVRRGLLTPLNFSPSLALVFQTTFQPCVIGCPWWRQCGSWLRRMTLFWHRLVLCVLLGCSHRRRVRGQVAVHSSFGQLLYFIFYGGPTVCPSGGGSLIWTLLFFCLLEHLKALKVEDVSAGKMWQHNQFTQPLNRLWTPAALPFSFLFFSRPFRYFLSLSLTSSICVKCPLPGQHSLW